MAEENLHHLIERCEAYLHDNHYAAISISNYKKGWKNGVVKYMELHCLDMYSPPVGDECLCYLKKFGRYSDGSLNEFRRSVRVLNDMLMLGYIRKSSKVPVEYKMDGAIGVEMLKFIEEQRELRRAEQTLVHHMRNLSYFLEYLTQEKDLKSPSDITEGDIASYIDSCSNKVSARSSIRMLMAYWHKNGITAHDFEEFFRFFKVRPKEKVPSFYSQEDVETIEKSVNRNCPIGKRDYAIILLASRLGLRASDIRTLTFEDIDWERNIIRKKMYKTGGHLELPLLADVGNAIIDYLQNGRPDSDAKTIFIMHRQPYTSLSVYGVCSKINSLIQESGVDTEGKHHGLHSLRHSLASALLSKSTPIGTISEILGHQSNQSTMCYLSIDLESLKECALEVPVVSDSFYNQKGGCFYGRH